MRIISFTKDGRAALGVRIGDGVIDLGVANPGLPATLRELLDLGEPAMEAVRTGVARAKSTAVLALSDIRYLPPVGDPRKIFCLGVNYREHAAEASRDVPTYPMVFARYATSLVGHLGDIVRPKCSDRLDYEAELAVVIGRRAKHVPEAQALDLVAGYSAFNDGSVRDYQRKTSQFTPGKNFDATGGFGPELVTPDELPAGGRGLRIRTRLNGTTLQDSNTDLMIFDVARTISLISEWITLEPGDVIVTGTPVGVGAFRDPPIFMKAGDVCEIDIEGVGILRNGVVDEA